MATVTETELKTYLLPQEVEAMVDKCRNLRDRLIIKMLFRTGMRVSELVSIKLKDTDLNSGVILIKHLKRTQRKVCLKCGTKTGRKSMFCPKCGVSLKDAGYKESERRRLLRIDDESLSMLREYLAKRNTKSDRVIPLTRQQVLYIVREAAEEVGIGKLLNPVTGKYHYVTPHRLRDSFAVYALSQNSSPESKKHLQDWLGHQSFDTTARYAKYSPIESWQWYKQLWQN